jgi:hypothetical protein
MYTMYTILLLLLLLKGSETLFYVIFIINLIILLSSDVYCFQMPCVPGGGGGVFYDAVSISDYMASNHTMVLELKAICNEVTVT